MVPAEHKRQRREEARIRRDGLARTLDAAAAGRLAERFIEAQPPVRNAVVAGYWPKGSEIDCRPLLEALHAAGCRCCLPVVAGPDVPLVFRLWRPGMALVEGAFGIMEPPADAPAVIPELVLVPMLAFDAHGHRLGYGGGYYDRTLAALRRESRVVAVGLAYAGQRVDDLPDEGHDQALDWIVTEEGVAG